jgi:hypothetical protein
MLTAYVALVAEYPGFDTSLLLRVAAAIQKQVSRDVAPVWEVNAVVAPFACLEDVPIGYWPVVVTTRDLGGQDGTHLDGDGAPYALVEAGADWSLTASHECIEMILDPFGSRTVAGPSPRDDQGRAEFLVEVCDPCQSADTAYTVNDILVADFVTPAYFEMAGTFDALGGPTARYSYSGKMSRPREVLAGGYLCWRDAITHHWWQRSSVDGKTWTDVDLGALDPATRGQRSLREIVNSFTQHHERIGRSISGELAGRVSKREAIGSRASRNRAIALRGHARTLRPLAEPGPPGSQIHILESPQAMRPELPLGDEIDRAIASVTQRPELPDSARVLEALRSAKAQWDANHAASARTGAPVAFPEGELAVVQSAVRSPLVTPHPSLLTGRSLVGFCQYDGLDVRWLATVWNHLFRPVVPFPVAPANAAETLVHRLPPQATIALAGDWGTGNVAARRVATEIAKTNPTYTIHLGDVYYSGTEGEETDNLLAAWPCGSAGSFALNGNHEMYSGGQGYFGVALTSEKFAIQAPYSYFALANDDWVILGLDSAYVATEFFQVGALHDSQLAWLRALRDRNAFVRADGSRKKLIVLSHHQALDTDGTKKSPVLWNQVTTALGLPDYWYWGHIHGVAVFHPVDEKGAIAEKGTTLRARLVGHGGVPYIADPSTPALAWTESAAKADLIEDGSASRSRNGFALLHFDGGSLAEELYDELGNRRWTSEAVRAG